MYKYLTGMENLLQFAAMDKTISPQRIKDVVDMVGLQHRVNDKVNTYSLGIRQLLGIAQAIMARPKLLILDEPTNGLDPAGMTEFRNLSIKPSPTESVNRWKPSSRGPKFGKSQTLKVAITISAL